MASPEHGIKPDSSNAEPSHAGYAVPTLDYANLKASAAPGDGLATASLVCGLLFFPAIVVWGGEGIAFLLVSALLPFLAVGCGLSARAAEKKAGRSRRRTFTGLSLGWFELALVTAFALVVPQMGRARESAKRIMCASNLRQIGQGILLYANDNQGRFPPDLDAIMLTQDLTFQVLVCPSTNHTTAQGPTTQTTLQNMHAEPGHCSYVYVGGSFTNDTVKAEHVIAYEPLSNHDDAGMNVLFGDGHVDFVPKTEAEYVLSELQAGQNPPRPDASPASTAPLR